MDKAPKKKDGKENQCKVIKLEAYRKHPSCVMSKAKSLALFLKYDEDCSAFD